MFITWQTVSFIFLCDLIGIEHEINVEYQCIPKTMLHHYIIVHENIYAQDIPYHIDREKN